MWLPWNFLLNHCLIGINAYLCSIMNEFNDMQSIKRRLFAMRNGVVADALRRGGSPFRIIFGLVIPQLDEIAKSIGYDNNLARRLWANSTTRESMLIAPMLIDACTFTIEDAIEWASQSPSTEVTDILVHKLLRRLPYSFELATQLAADNNDMLRYAAMRLLWHHINEHPEETETLARKELLRDCPLTHMPACQIIDEISFLKEI